MNVGNIKLDTRVLDRIARDLDVNTDRALAGIAFQVQAETQANIVNKHIYDTGALHNSIEAEKKQKDLYWVHDAVDYGIYNELGTSKMAARPFMVPAVEAVRRFVDDKWGGLFR
jgi:HK97 gp10 family phage protein